MFLIAYNDRGKNDLKLASYMDDIFVGDGELGLPKCFETADAADEYREDRAIDSVIIEIPTVD